MNNNKRHTKLSIYGSTYGNLKAMKINNNFVTQNKNIQNRNRFTFQLNYKHPCFHKLSQIKINSKQYEQRGDIFEYDVGQICHNYRTIYISISNDKKALKSSVEKFYVQRLNEQERNFFKFDLQKIYAIIDRGRISIKFNIKISVRILKKKLAKIFDHIFDAKHFELYVPTQDTILKSSGTFKEQQENKNKFSFDDYNCRCCIVLYNTNAELDVNSCNFYNIRINDPSEIPQPMLLETYGKRLLIRYKKQFKVIDFVNYIFSFIYNSKNHIFYDEYKDLIDLYYGFNNENEGDSDYDMIQLDTNDKPHKCNDILILAVNGANTFFQHNVYSSNETMVCDRKLNFNFNIFLMRNGNKPSTPLKHVTLLMKFVLSEKAGRCSVNEKLTPKTEVAKIDNMRYIGFPLSVYIDPNDSLYNIVRKHLGKAMKLIICCYRIKVNDKVISVAKSKWGRYKPYWKFVKDNPNDFLIFKMKPDGKDGCIPRWKISKDISSMFTK
eukprot:363370_1